MKLKNMVQTLIDDHGFSQLSLARELTARGITCSQPTIGRILAGTDTSYTTGDAIRQIYSEKQLEASAA